MYLTQGLHRARQRNPHGISTVFGERSWTVDQTAERVARLAGALRELGVRRGDRVAMLALNSDRYSEFYLAVPWADAVFVPVNTRWAVPEISHSLVECGAEVLLVDDTFTDLVPPLRAAHPALRVVIHCGEEPTPDGMLSYEELVDSGPPVEDARRGGDDLAGIYYTGGTTGVSKGVMLSHANLLTSALGSIAAGAFVDPDGRLLHAAPMFHLAAGGIWAAQTVVGGTHVIVPSFDPAFVLRAIADQRVTAVLLVPTMIGMLVRHPDAGSHDLTSLRQLIYGASPMTDATLDEAMKLFPTAEFSQAYGMTELAPVATILAPADHQHPRRRRSAGRAAPHAEVRIVDPEDREVPRGTVGEIVCRGNHVMLGYWNKPEETAQAVRDGWMHTGDAGSMDSDGYVYIVDRIKDMIITGGENVYSVEVENVLTRHRAVAACAVIGVPDPEWGERVHAVVVLRPSAEVTEDDLRTFARSQLANYKVPRSVSFTDALPTSGAGKVLKRELREQHWAGTERGVN